MANNLEIGIGWNDEELQKGIQTAEKQLRKLENRREVQLVTGLDTSRIDRQIASTRANLEGLTNRLNTAGGAAQGFNRNTANAGNTLTNFGRIAQDAPFGIQGIGNNLTATAEAFGSLSQQSGGAGGALRALGSTLMGPGGVIFAFSLLVSGLTIMNQKGITVADGIDYLTGKFDSFKKELQEVNAEAAKTGTGEASMMKGFVAAAQNVDLSMRDRLIAVKKLQDEYPAYFGNLSKEQILNGNVASAVKAATNALIAKAKAQGFANKVAEIAEKQVPLKDKEADLQAKINAKAMEFANLLKQIETNKGDERLADRWVRAGKALASLKEDLLDTKTAISNLDKESAKWQNEVNKNVAIEIPTEFKPPTVKKPKVVKQLQEQVNQIGKGLKPIGLDSLITVDSGIFKSNINMGKDMDAFINRLRSLSTETRMILFEWNNVLADGFGSIGTSIGEALANGTSVLNAIGKSLLSSLSSLLSSMGDKLITVGLTAVISGTALASMFTPAGIAAGVAAIALGTALKAGSGALGSMSKNMSGGSSGGGKISAGNSVSSPTSSVSNGSSFAGGGNVVFEISGQSLVGVLSNTLNKNIKLGGTMPAI